MEWKKLEGKEVFIKLKHGDILNGKIFDVDDSIEPLIWITLLDKFDKKVTIIHSEIVKLEVKE